jgi:hypothetical protein
MQNRCQDDSAGAKATRSVVPAAVFPEAENPFPWVKTTG